MADKQSFCDPFQKLIKLLMEEESLTDVEPPMLVEVEEDDEELFAFILEYFRFSDEFEITKEKETIPQSLPNSLATEHFATEADFLARMDDMLAMVHDDNMDDLADLVVDWVV